MQKIHIHSDIPSEQRLHLETITKLFSKAKRCLIVTGAGISVSAGIPDFRSENGLYNLVKKKFPGSNLKGKDLFDATLFRDPTSTQLFFTFMGELKDMIDKCKITTTHNFIKYLDDKGRLLRCYTQNIDCIERRLDLNHDMSDKKNARVVQLHGDMHSVTCMKCSVVLDWKEEHGEAFKEGRAPECPECLASEEKRVAAGMRSRGVGVLRPNVVLYNETHCQSEWISAIANYDMKRKPDLLVVMGTSLKIPGLKNLVKSFAAAIHGPTSETPSTGLKSTSKTLKGKDNAENDAKSKPTEAPNKNRGHVIFINKTEASKEWESIFDYHVVGDSDEVIKIIQDGMEDVENEQAKRREQKEKREAKRREEEAKQRKISEVLQTVKVAQNVNVKTEKSKNSNDIKKPIFVGKPVSMSFVKGKAKVKTMENEVGATKVKGKTVRST